MTKAMTIRMTKARTTAGMIMKNGFTLPGFGGGLFSCSASARGCLASSTLISSIFRPPDVFSSVGATLTTTFLFSTLTSLTIVSPLLISSGLFRLSISSSGSSSWCSFVSGSSLFSFLISAGFCTYS